MKIALLSATAAVAAAAQVEGLTRLFEVTCATELTLFPDHPVAKFGGTMPQLENMFESLRRTMADATVDACQGKITYDEAMSISLLDPANIIAAAGGDALADKIAIANKCPEATLKFLSPMVRGLKSDEIEGIQDFIKLPSTCNKASWAAGGCGMAIEFAPGFKVAISMKPCAGSSHPAFAIDCVGDVCKTMGKPCTKDDDCHGATKCETMLEKEEGSDSYPLGDLLNGIKDIAKEMGVTECTEEGCKGGQAVIDSLVDALFDALGWSPRDAGTFTTQQNLKICGFKETHENLGDDLSGVIIDKTTTPVSGATADTETCEAAKTGEQGCQWDDYNPKWKDLTFSTQHCQNSWQNDVNFDALDPVDGCTDISMSQRSVYSWEFCDSFFNMNSDVFSKGSRCYNNCIPKVVRTFCGFCKQAFDGGWDDFDCDATEFVEETLKKDFLKASTPLAIENQGYALEASNEFLFGRLMCDGGFSLMPTSTIFTLSGVMPLARVTNKLFTILKKHADAQLEAPMSFYTWMSTNAVPSMQFLGAQMTKTYNKDFGIAKNVAMIPNGEVEQQMDCNNYDQWGNQLCSTTYKSENVTFTAFPESCSPKTMKGGKCAITLPMSKLVESNPDMTVDVAIETCNSLGGFPSLFGGCVGTICDQLNNPITLSKAGAKCDTNTDCPTDYECQDVALFESRDLIFDGDGSEGEPCSDNGDCLSGSCPEASCFQLTCSERRCEASQAAHHNPPNAFFYNFLNLNNGKQWVKASGGTSYGVCIAKVGTMLFGGDERRLQEESFEPDISDLMSMEETTTTEQGLFEGETVTVQVSQIEVSLNPKASWRPPVDAVLATGGAVDDDVALADVSFSYPLDFGVDLSAETLAVLQATSCDGVRASLALADDVPCTTVIEKVAGTTQYTVYAQVQVDGTEAKTTIDTKIETEATAIATAIADSDFTEVKTVQAAAPDAATISDDKPAVDTTAIAEVDDTKFEIQAPATQAPRESTDAEGPTAAPAAPTPSSDFEFSFGIRAEPVAVALLAALALV